MKVKLSMESKSVFPEKYPIEKTLKLLNRKWTIMILRDMFMGKKYFHEFKDEHENLNNNVLSDTLKFMEKENLIKKELIDKKNSYQLTRKGKKLNRILYEILDYSLDNLLNNKYNELEVEKIKSNHLKLLNIK